MSVRQDCRDPPREVIGSNRVGPRGRLIGIAGDEGKGTSRSPRSLGFRPRRLAVRGLGGAHLRRGVRLPARRTRIGSARPPLHRTVVSVSQALCALASWGPPAPRRPRASSGVREEAVTGGCSRDGRIRPASRMITSFRCLMLALRGARGRAGRRRGSRSFETHAGIRVRWLCTKRAWTRSWPAGLVIARNML